MCLIQESSNTVIDEMARISNPDSTVNGLSVDELDVCMRYIYKGLESGENSNVLLKWHESVFNKAGTGCIVRALTARNRKAEQASKQVEDDDD
jgi:hypothetical protein